MNLTSSITPEELTEIKKLCKSVLPAETYDWQMQRGELRAVAIGGKDESTPDGNPTIAYNIGDKRAKSISKFMNLIREFIANVEVDEHAR